MGNKSIILFEQFTSIIALKNLFWVYDKDIFPTNYSMVK